MRWPIGIIFGFSLLLCGAEGPVWGPVVGLALFLICVVVMKEYADGDKR